MSRMHRLVIATLASVLASAEVSLRVLPCGSWSGDTSTDGWNLVAGDGGLAIRNSGFCLDAPADATKPVMTTCDGRKTQLWQSVPGEAKQFQLKSVAGHCLQVMGTQYSLGPGVLLGKCEQGKFMDGSVRWSTGPAVRQGSELLFRGGACCGDIFETRPVCLAIDRTKPCKEQPVSSAWCDASLDASSRAKALLAEMTLEEKASNMDSHNFGVPRLGVPPNIFGEALHGLVSGCGKKIDFGEYTSTGCPTSFPQVITLGASWNRTLWSSIGSAVSDEVRGIYSQQGEVGFEGSLFLWSPNVNPFRDPRWGRGQEVASEEPLVVAEFGATYIKNLQGEVKHGGHTYLKAVATAKHYFDYDLEGKRPITREDIDVHVSDRDQMEYFLPPFRAAIQQGNVHSIMCAYNAVNGVPSCMHGDMINGKMRDEWGFDGFVVSDCDALSDGASHQYIKQHFNGSLEVQAQQSVRGGTDLNCGALYGEQNVAAVQKGLLREEELDIALERIYTKTFQLGIVDGKYPENPNPFTKLGPENVDTPSHRELALEAALQSIVLLKNDHKKLPLKASRTKKLALIGPHANGSTIWLGGPNYYGVNTIVDEYTPVFRAQAQLPETEVVYQQGCAVSGTDRSGFVQAVTASKEADEVVLFLGLDSSIENEGHDRESLELPGLQAELALAVAEAASRPVSIVLANGGPVAIRELKESTKVGAILEAFLPGQFAAEAIMQLILGKRSPSGLLPLTIYDADFVDRRPIANLDLRAAGGVTYRYFDGEPLWPFGFGLSYTDFRFSGDPSIHQWGYVFEAANLSWCFPAHVTNEGDAVADVVLLAFISSNHSDAPQNPKLCDFVRVSAMKPGEKLEVQLCTNAALPLVDDQGRERYMPGEYTVTVGVQGGVGGAGAGSVIGTLAFFLPEGDDDDVAIYV